MTHGVHNTSSSSVLSGTFPARGPAATPLPSEVVARVAFDLGEHAGQMKVTMVEGNTAASVVAHCCTALREKIGTPMASANVMLEIDVSKYAEDAAANGYMYGLCDVLTHPDVKEILDSGKPLHLKLSDLPADHPNGMYFEEVRPDNYHSQTQSHPTAYASDPQQRRMLERAMGEEVQRELSHLDFYRPMLGNDVLDPNAPHTTATMQAHNRVARVERGMTAGERLSSVLGEMSLNGPEEVLSDMEQAGTQPQMDGGKVAEEAGGSSVSGGLPHDASQSLALEHSVSATHHAPLSPQRSPVSRKPSHPHQHSSLPSRAADLLKHECDELKQTLNVCREETRSVSAALAEMTSERNTLKRQLEVEQSSRVRAEETLKQKAHDFNELTRAKEEVEELKADNARHVAKVAASAAREKALQAEVLSLQKELSAAEAEAAAQLDTLLPTILNASKAALPPPPPPPPAAAKPAPTTPKPRYQTITKIDPKLLQSPDTPQVELLADDSVGTIVAKLTGKPALGMQVDRSLLNPLFQIDGEGVEGGEGGGELPDAPLSPSEKVKQTLKTLTEYINSEGVEEEKEKAPRREEVLQQVADIRTWLSAPQTPYSTASAGPGAVSVVGGYTSQKRQRPHYHQNPFPPPPPSVAGAGGGGGGGGGGPGSPGGPLRSSSSYSYMSMPSIPPPPPGPPPPHYANAAAAYITRPPGL